MKQSFVGKFLLAFGLGLFASSSSWAALVTWDLNPSNLNQNVGSASHTYTVSGTGLTARGYDNNNGVGVAHNLFYKYESDIGGAVEKGLGLTGIADAEVYSNTNGTPANFIQLDLRSILAAGFTGGQVEVGSVQSGETFRLFGSNTLGQLGSQIGSALGSQFDDQFVSIANFGSYQFISVAAGSGDVLPIAFRATPVPEIDAFTPVLGLIAAVGFTHILRRRRSARLDR